MTSSILSTVDGGTFLPSNVDEGITDELAVFKNSDAIVISYTDKNSAASPNDARIFISETGIQTLHDLSSRTNLSAELSFDDSNVEVNDPSLFVDATVDEPGIVWVGAERIIYTGKSGNLLTGIRRMTAGTSLDVSGSIPTYIQDTYPIGTLVYPDAAMPFLPPAIVPPPPHN